MAGLVGMATLHGGLTQVNSERTAKGGDRRGEFIGVHRFQIWHTKHPVGVQRCHRFQTWHHNHPVEAQQDGSGPVVRDTGLHGFCFAAIDSRSGTPTIPLGLNGMILGPVLATWVLF